MRGVRPVLWGLLALCLVASALWPRNAPRSPSFAVRLLGPVSSLAASGQWVRMRRSWVSGRSDLACTQAELALELDPGATTGWAFFASHLALDRGAPDREPDPARRTRWMEAALDVLSRGEAVARHPAELALQRGTLLVRVGESGGEIPWPGGARDAWTEAQGAFERACELDPGRAEAWAQAAANRFLRLGGEELEPDPVRRLAALEEALAKLDRGMPTAREPESLWFQRGYFLERFAEGPFGTLHPLGARGLLHLAKRAFERAREGGHPLARGEERAMLGAHRHED